MTANPLGRLLLVEDEAVLRGLVSQFLALEHYEVVEAEDGQAAVEAFEGRGPFDVVLLDLTMPRVPGVEACRRIKAIDPEQPFLVCSAAILESHRTALEALGVAECLSKPYHPLELLSRIRAITALAGPHAQARRGRDAQAWRNDPAQAPRSARTLSDSRVFD
jgi:DNA-binding response OmpR family regulator